MLLRIQSLEFGKPFSQPQPEQRLKLFEWVCHWFIGVRSTADRVIEVFIREVAQRLLQLFYRF